MWESIYQSALYVISAPLFYTSMGLTAMTSIFIGAAMYNGEVKAATKGILAISSYAGLLLLTTIPRVIERLGRPEVIFNQERTSMAYAGAVTIFFLTIWYVLGMIIGVFTVQRVKRKAKQEHLAKVK